MRCGSDIRGVSAVRVDGLSAALFPVPATQTVCAHLREGNRCVRSCCDWQGHLGPVGRRHRETARNDWPIKEEHDLTSTSATSLLILTCTPGYHLTRLCVLRIVPQYIYANL